MSFIKKLLSLLSIRKYSKLILLGGIVFIIGFIWHFPFNLLKDFIRSKIQQNTRVIIDVQDIKPSLPLGFTFIDPRVSNIQITGKNLDFDLELLKISTTPWSLITFGLSQSGTIHYKAKKKTFSAKGHIVFGKNILGFSTNTKNLQIDDAILIQE
ncbi:MAG: hypothetical protein KDD48_07795, partial [Bdellovibrionales bacterium]|nr:hypothetical protein [Bdellovibrionales bacterium]